MFIRVSGPDLKSGLRKLLMGSKTDINLMLKDGWLYLQTSGAIVDELRLQPIEVDCPGLDMTVTIDQSIELLGKADIIITVFDGLLVFEQGNFSYTAIKSPESRVNISGFLADKDITFYPDEIKLYNDKVKSFEELIRILGLTRKSISIHDSVAYLRYENTVYVDTLRLPNMSMQADALKRLASICGRTKTNNCGIDKNTLIFEVSKDEVACMPLSPENVLEVEAVQTYMNKCKLVGEVDLANYSKSLELICKIYKKCMVEVTFCKDKGLRIYVDSISTRFSIGSSAEGLFTIKMNSGQLSIINKLFNSTSQVWKGENMVCLKSPNSNKALFIAGTSY